MSTDTTPPSDLAAASDPLAQLSDMDQTRIARITEAFMGLSPAGREAVLLWLLPQQLESPMPGGIKPPPVLTETLTDVDKGLIPQIIGDFAQLEEVAQEVVLNLALPQYVED